MIRIRITVIVLILVQLSIVSGFSQNKIDAAFSNDQDVSVMIDNYIQNLPQYKSLNGVVLVSLSDSIIYNKAFGYADISHNIKNTSSTRFQVGSVTKPFTAVLGLQLIEKRLLSLDDNVSKFFPDFPNGEKITIHQLLTHTSGIPQHYTSINNFFKSFDKEFVTRKEMIIKIGGLPRKLEPGQKFTYTSLGYYVLAAIIEKVSELSFSEALEENIFKPAGMNNSFIENNKMIIENMSVGYERGINSNLIKCNYENKSVFKGAGDLVTTAYDLYLFHQALDFESGLLLEDETKQLLFKQYEQNYGYGFMNLSFPLSSGDTILLASHQGGSYGYSAIFDHILSHHASIIILTNTQTPEAFIYREDIGDFLINCIDPNFPTKKLDFVNGPDVRLDKMLGFYQLDNGRKVSIIKLDNRYYYCIPGRELRTLMNQNDNTFDLSGFGGLKIIINYEDVRFDILRYNSIVNSAVLNTPEKNPALKYSGKYISTELQKTYEISTEGKCLVISGFSEDKDVLFYPTKKENEFLSEVYRIRFTYNEEINIVGFKLFTPWTDQMFGSVFEKL